MEVEVVQGEGSEGEGRACHTTHRAEFNQVRLVSWQVRVWRARSKEGRGGLQEAAWLHACCHFEQET